MQTLLLFFLKYVVSLVSGLGKQKKLFILIYHRVLDEPDYMRASITDKEAFTWQMGLLSKYFNVLPLDEALDKLEADQLPPRAVCITFDDGYADNYLNALPILKKFNLKATFFIADGFLNGGTMWNDKIIEAIKRMTSDKLDLRHFALNVFDISDKQEKNNAAEQIISKIKHSDMNERIKIADFIASRVDNMPLDLMLNDDQLIKLHEAGMEIGGHTVSHPILAKIDEQTTEQELTQNKQKLEQLLNTTIRFFAYPNGKPVIDYSIAQIEQVKSAGYQAALSTTMSVVDVHSDRFQLPRFTPWDKHPVTFMLRMIQKLYQV